MKGTIALDIDGTLTADGKNHTIPQEVVDYLVDLSKQGWRLVFITGRTFYGAFKTLKYFAIPYYMAVQNGAIILEMPAQKIISKRYLHRSIFEEMDEVFKGLPSDYTIFSGYENKDVTYYRPKQFSKELITYLTARSHSYQETWHPVESYQHMQINDFPSIKCFGGDDTAYEIARRIEARLGLHVPVIRDAFDGRYYVVQATHSDITKGQALLDLLAALGGIGKVIAAGDDLNDLPMLVNADVKIAMKGSPKPLLDIADIVAPPASELGIIAALKIAILD